jgi:Ca2+-binding EF-hand superfamily protein
MFNQLDRNHDGQLTVAEFRAAQSDDVHFVAAAPPPPPGRDPGPFMIPLRGPPPPRPPLAAAPPNVVQSLARREFGRMDIDGNTSVTFAEFESSHRALLRSSFVALDANEDGRLTADELAIGPGPGDVRVRGAELVHSLDRNSDQAVSWAEFSDPP